MQLLDAVHGGEAQPGTSESHCAQRGDSQKSRLVLWNRQLSALTLRLSTRGDTGADTDAAFVAALPPEAVAICDGGDPARAEQVT